MVKDMPFIWFEVLKIVIKQTKQTTNKKKKLKLASITEPNANGWKYQASGKQKKINIGP